MENQKKNTPPKFNAYWIYGIIITLLLGMSLFGGDSGFQNVQKTNISAFERYLNDGDISEVIVINKNLAQITLTPEALNNRFMKEHGRPIFWGKKTLKGPITNLKWGTWNFFNLNSKRPKKTMWHFAMNFAPSKTVGSMS